MYNFAQLAAIVLSASTTATASTFVKRDSWGAAFSLGPAKQEIISTTTTIYPGTMPSDQQGYLFVWLGISNGTGDLIQSIIGSYPEGGSECSGTAADTTWCISSEVYGLASNGYPNQWVGSLTTAEVNFANGIKLNYTLIDKDSYLWLQTMEDAVTGELLSTFNKTSGPMLGWGTALECQDGPTGVPCSGTIAEQTYVNSTIILEAADETFINTLGMGTGVTGTLETADGGKTWTIAKISIPAMNSSAAATPSSSSAAAVVAVKASSSVAISTSVETMAPIKSNDPTSSTAESSVAAAPTSVQISSVSAASVSSVSSATGSGGSSCAVKSKHHGHTGHHAKPTGRV